jgi:xylulokinase
MKEAGGESRGRNTLGLDLGTSELKALVMGADGAVLATAHAPLTWQQPQPGWAEQDAQDWWRAAVAACAQLKWSAPEAMAEVRAIGLSGQMHGATLLDAHDQVLRPCMLWNDTRSAAQCEALTRDCPSLHQIAGNLAMPGFTAPKLAWVREHEREIFDRVACVLLPKDWLRLRLTGTKVSEMSDAAGTLWLDVARRDWSDTLLAATGLTRAHMPALVEGHEVSGHLSPEAARELGLPSGIPVVGGAGDNAASAIGIGAVKPGDSFVSLGTSGVLFSVTDRHRPNVAEAVHAFCHALPGVWHQMAVMLSAASSLTWITRATGHANEGELLAKVSGLSEADRRQAPVFLPYLSGERTPHNDAAASGVFLGLRHAHAAPHLAWSVIEGVSFGLRDGLDAMRRAGSHIDEVQLVGGGSRSTLWAQLLADVLGVRVRIGEASNVGAALGAARLALLSQGEFNAELTARHVVEVCRAPNTLHCLEPQPSAVLEQRLATYRSAYRALRPVLSSSSKESSP